MDDKTSKSEPAKGITTEPHEPYPSSVTSIKRVGQYHIKRVLASGGMGTVYQATQEKPRRVVAIKLMKQGIASKSALRRFEYESQILARLRHPGIAQIYEAGTHRDDSGTVPYFAMEYIPHALSLTKYAKDKKLSTREKLDLFTQVCDAVHHGHQKGIIHRDLKPGNILVDSNGQVKVIDFGVARGTDSDMAVTTLQTDIGQLVGTLQYMSPEQCVADPHDIDTRSDVYALGVVLYELLAEKLPYKISSKQIFEGTRIIREQQPTNITTIDKTLKGDIETIIYKALEKDRERRYQSTIELSQDIRRYLGGEAVIARPPSIVYQLRIFARRNKAFFGAMAAVFVVLLGGVIVSSSMYLRSEENRLEAEANQVKAEKEAETNRITLDFMEEMFQSIDPIRGEVGDMRSMMDEAVRKIDAGAFADLPEIEARVRRTIGITYRGLSAFDDAEHQLEIALRIGRRIFGEEHPETLRSRYQFGMFHHFRADFRESERTLREVYDSQRRVLGPEHPDTMMTANRLAWAIHSQRRYQEAEVLIRPTVDAQRRILGQEHRDTLRSEFRLASILSDQGKLSEAVKLQRKILQICSRIYGEGRTGTLWTINSLCAMLINQGKVIESEQLARKAVEIARRRHGNNPYLMNSLLGKLSVSLRLQNKLAEAEQVAREALEIARRYHGDENPCTLDMLQNLINVLHEQGKVEESRPYTTEVIALRKQAAQQSDASALKINQYAWVLLTCKPEDLRDPETALPIAKRAVEKSDEKTQALHAGILDTLSLAYFMTGDTAKAIETQVKALALLPNEDSSVRTEMETNMAKFRAADAEAQKMSIEKNQD